MVLSRTRSASARQSRKRAVAFVVRGYGRAIVEIAATAFVGGLVEALFLITVTKTAFAISKGQDQIGVMSGWSLSVPEALLAGIALVGLRIVLSGYGSWQSASISGRVTAQLRERLSRAYLSSSWEVQQAQRAGSLQELLTAYVGQASGLMGSLAQGVVAGAGLVALLGMALVVDTAGALLLVLFVIALGLLLRPLRSIVRRRAHTANTAGMDFAVAVNEVAELGFELQVFHVQDKAHARVSEAMERARKAGQRVQFASGLLTPFYIGLAYLAIVAALAAVAASNTSSLTSLGATMLVMLRSLTYGQGVQGAYLSVFATVPAIEELQHRLDTFEGSRRVDEGQPVVQVGLITAEQVSFAYPQGEAVLRDISFTIAPHEIIGIVGPSGAGKSTLVQLLLGLRYPDTGRVLAGGRDISTFDRAEWAQKVAFVPQAAHLVSGTIADNIRFLRDGVTQDDIERAARLAHLHEDVEGFPER